MTITMRCQHCNGDDVSRDAWADWDVIEQAWVLRNIFDYAHCHACDCETRLIAVERVEA